MIHVMFICHGNICRSPMAEFVFRQMVKDRGLSDKIKTASCAVSGEEIGNGVHHGTRRKLKQEGIPLDPDKTAIRLTRRDYQHYDYLVGMERRNIEAILRIVGSDSEHKVSRLLDFTQRPRDIADPWYTGDFDLTYSDVREGCEALLTHILTHDKSRL